VEASHIYQRFLNGEVTAAGSFPASKVLVVGTGVAGLAAISAASNMGAIVRAFDTRLECKEQVESLGGAFLVLDFAEDGADAGTGYAKVMSETFYKKEMEMFREQAKECRIIITTAAIPGRPAPKLIMKDAVDNMAAGTVIVDLAGATGGNCELTKPGETYVYDNRVTIIGATDLISRMSWQASSMYSNNMANLLDLLCTKPATNAEEKRFFIDMEDPVVRGMTCVYENAITWPPPESVTTTSVVATSPRDDPTIVKRERKPSILATRVLDLASLGEFVAIIFGVVFFGIVAAYAPVSFGVQLLYFILAGFLGCYLIWAVEPALFTPLMSTSNSLSGVVILGGILMTSAPNGSPTSVLGCIAVSVAAINVFGGFAVSYRMLLMFKKEKA
jgi:NAD(P) transhydrogenase subunit alpha